VVRRTDPSRCPTGKGAPSGRPNDTSSKTSEWNDCEAAGRIELDLFPATTVLVRATVVDPNGKRWDLATSKFVVGPVETRVFYQFGGRHPDLNHNGVDDYIDIAQGHSKDANGDGVPDEAQPRHGTQLPWWLWWLILIVVIVVIVIRWRRHHP